MDEVATAYPTRVLHRVGRPVGWIGWLSAVPRRRWEPWRDWAVIGVLTHAVLVATAATRPHGVWLVLAGVALSVCFAVGTITVLHDAGHRMFSAREWPNVLAVQTATPAGLWVGHWTVKHRVHHKLSQVYPVDEATRSSALVRLHPAAASNRWQRGQHVYAWALYGLVWLGELRSQLRYVRNGEVAGSAAPPPLHRRLWSFSAEKAMWLLVLAPYTWWLGWGPMAVLLVIAETLASMMTAVILVVGHINEGLTPTTESLGEPWAVNLVRTTVSFSTSNPLMRWLSGGMTHHLAHHLRPVAVRSELPRLHATVVRDVVAGSGVPLVEYGTLMQAVAGHYRRLRQLGRPASAPCVAGGADQRLGEFAA